MNTLFVLDEPNSNLDAEGEAALDHAIRVSMARGASVVVIAHRPSALASIQQIMVLTDGRVAAVGPRDEIMRKVLTRPAAGNGAARAAFPLYAFLGGRLRRALCLSGLRARSRSRPL